MLQQTTSLWEFRHVQCNAGLDYCMTSAPFIMEALLTEKATQIVVCGTGSIGMRHLRVLRDGLGLDPWALPIRHARAQELQAEGIRTVSDWRAVPGSAHQFAIIASDTSRHLADASAAVVLGADVLVEKPLASSVLGLRDFAQLVEEHGRRVFVACNLRFDAGLARFRDQLPRIGRVHAARIECQSFLPEWRPGTDYRRAYSARRDEGGVLRDLIHEIDYAVWLFGQPSALFARLTNSGTLGIESDEAADILWESPSDTSVSIRLDYVSRIPRRKMRAFGELGDLEWDYFGKRVSLALAGQPEQTWVIEQTRDQMMRDQAAAFLRSANDGSPSALATLAEGAFAVAVCDTARKSSSSGRIEPVLDWRTVLSSHPVLAVIPARGGSKGLPGKNIRMFAGLPLIAHSISFAGLCPEIDRCIVSTDSEKIASVAREHGGEVPFLRPAELSQDSTPTWPVLQHALREMEAREKTRFETLLLLDPTSPGRLQEDVTAALKMLEADPQAVGVVAVSEPHFNPRWTCVEDREGYMAQSFPSGQNYIRRQDVPRTYRINALLYLWRRDHILNESEHGMYSKPHLMLIVPEERAIHIDQLHDFQVAELMVREGLVTLPWLRREAVG